MSHFGLNENHLRRLATSMSMVDAAAARVLNLLDEKTTPKSMTLMEGASVTSSDRERIRELVARLQPLAIEFARKYELAKLSKDLRRTIAAEVSQIWTILENSHAQNLRGMGPLSLGVAQQLDRDLEVMLNLIKEVIQTLR